MVIEVTETKTATCIRISFEKDCEFDVYEEVKQLSKRLKKENLFYTWYIVGDVLLNVRGWVHDFKDKELNESSIYDFVRNNYNKAQQ